MSATCSCRRDDCEARRTCARGGLRESEVIPRCRKNPTRPPPLSIPLGRGGGDSTVLSGLTSTSMTHYSWYHAPSPSLWSFFVEYYTQYLHDWWLCVLKLVPTNISVIFNWSTLSVCTFCNPYNSSQLSNWYYNWIHALPCLSLQILLSLCAV